MRSVEPDNPAVANIVFEVQPECFQLGLLTFSIVTNHCFETAIEISSCNQAVIDTSDRVITGSPFSKTFFEAAENFIFLEFDIQAIKGDRQIIIRSELKNTGDRVTLQRGGTDKRVMTTEDNFIAREAKSGGSIVCVGTRITPATELLFLSW